MNLANKFLLFAIAFTFEGCMQLEEFANTLRSERASLNISQKFAFSGDGRFLAEERDGNVVVSQIEGLNRVQVSEVEAASLVGFAVGTPFVSSTRPGRISFGETPVQTPFDTVEDALLVLRDGELRLVSIDGNEVLRRFSTNVWFNGNGGFATGRLRQANYSRDEFELVGRTGTTSSLSTTTPSRRSFLVTPCRIDNGFSRHVPRGDRDRFPLIEHPLAANRASGVFATRLFQDLLLIRGADGRVISSFTLSREVDPQHVDLFRRGRAYATSALYQCNSRFTGASFSPSGRTILYSFAEYRLRGGQSEVRTRIFQASSNLSDAPRQEIYATPFQRNIIPTGASFSFSPTGAHILIQDARSGRTRAFQNSLEPDIQRFEQERNAAFDARDCDLVEQLEQNLYGYALAPRCFYLVELAADLQSTSAIGALRDASALVDDGLPFGALGLTRRVFDLTDDGAILVEAQRLERELLNPEFIDLP